MYIQFLNWVYVNNKGVKILQIHDSMQLLILKVKIRFLI